MKRKDKPMNSKRKSELLMLLRTNAMTTISSWIKEANDEGYETGYNDCLDREERGRDAYINPKNDIDKLVHLTELTELLSSAMWGTSGGCSHALDLITSWILSAAEGAHGEGFKMGYIIGEEYGSANVREVGRENGS